MGTLAPVPRMCGREAEIQVLGEALDRVAAGGPAIVVVEGEAGIGKTRLLAEVLQDAAGRGMRVAAGRAEELERTRPFGVLAAAFGCARSSPDPRRAAIAGLLTSQGGGELGPVTVTSDPGLRFQVVDAFTDLVEELALSGPVVLGLDDLQWADPSSLLTVGVLARRLTGLPVGVIGCVRPSPRVAELDRLAAVLEAAGARHLTLHPLTAQAVTGLVAQAVAAEPGPRLLAEVAGAAGNPLFVTELLGALAQEGAITTAGGRAEVLDSLVLVADSPGTDHASVFAALTRAIHSLDPAAEVATPGGYQAAVNAQIAQNTWTIHVSVIVLLVYVVIAALNTLAMAALARRAELAVLRLAGATRGQLLRMVRIEQAVLLGLALVVGGAIAALTLIPMVKGTTGSAAPYIPAGGWLAVIGGTIVLGMTGTILPIMSGLRTPPIEAIGTHE